MAIYQTNLYVFSINNNHLQPVPPFVLLHTLTQAKQNQLNTISREITTFPILAIWLKQIVNNKNK